jgi:hypothetical protein
MQESVAKTEYCKITLNDANLKAFLYAVKNHYWYQMYLGMNAFSIQKSYWYCFKVCVRDQHCLWVFLIAVT